MVVVDVLVVVEEGRVCLRKTYPSKTYDLLRPGRETSFCAM
jgi:hypothetical protein